MDLRVHDGVWLYFPLEDTIAEAGLWELETYVSRRQNTVVQFIATGTIMDLYLEAERRPGSRVEKRWWGKYRLDLEGMRTAAQ